MGRIERKKGIKQKMEKKIYLDQNDFGIIRQFLKKSIYTKFSSQKN